MLEAEGCKFRTSGDTEVLSIIYCTRLGLKLLRGMFAFAIWDNIKKVIFMARDISGENYFTVRLIAHLVLQAL